MNDQAWVKLYRKSLYNEVRRHDPTAWRLFETLLLLVDNRTATWKGGRYQLTEADGYLNSSTIYKALKRLEKKEMITLKSNTRYTEIHICNLSEYAKVGNTSSNSEVTTNEQQSNNEVTLFKETKRNKKDIYMSSSVKDEILSVLNEETGRSFKVYPDEKRTRDTAKQFTPEEVRKALKKMKLDDWHKSKMKQLSSGYLLSTALIDQFLNYKTVSEAYLDQPKKTIKPKTSMLSRSEINKLEYQT